MSENEMKKAWEFLCECSESILVSNTDKVKLLQIRVVVRRVLVQNDDLITRMHQNRQLNS